MINQRAVLPDESGGWWREPQVPPLRFGRDDNSFWVQDASAKEALTLASPLVLRHQLRYALV
jgi:hypothetical protein